MAIRWCTSTVWVLGINRSDTSFAYHRSWICHEGRHDDQWSPQLAISPDGVSTFSRDSADVLVTVDGSEFMDNIQLAARHGAG